MNQDRWHRLFVRWVASKVWFSRLLRVGDLGWCRLREWAAPWWVLAIAPLRLLRASGSQRHIEQLRYWQALSKIDFLGLYQTLNDLIW